MTVGFALPAVAAASVEGGTLSAYSFGRSGQVELRSIAKEIMDLASNYMIMAKALIPDSYIVIESTENVWNEVVMRVFPGLDEMPTVATIHSEAETLIKESRGDVIYTEELG
jgi:hypothetical protein